MRIALTAITEQGLHDVVVDGDDTTTVDGLASAMARSLITGGEHGRDSARADVVRLTRGRHRGRRPYSRRPATDPGDKTRLWLNGHILDPAQRATNVLRDGDVISFDPGQASATVRNEPDGHVEIRVVGGAAAGSVHRLGFGTAEIGGRDDCALAVPGLPPRAATVTVKPDRIMVEADRSDAAVALDGEPVEEATEWPEGEVLRAGPAAFTVHQVKGADAHLDQMPDGGLAYNRPPRLRPPARKRTMPVPIEPVRAEGQPLMFIAAFLPMGLGIGLAIFMRSPFYLLFALMTPALIVGQWLSNRRQGRRKYRQELKEYKKRLELFKRDLNRARIRDQKERREIFPDPAEVLLAATGPRQRLWERRIGNEDCLRLRVGLADQPALLEMVPEKGARPDADVPEPPTSLSVPVTLDLPELGVVGVTGPREQSLGLARWLTGQAAALHSPRDLSIVVLSTSAGNEQAWNWVRWLPHAAPRDGERCVTLIGGDPEAAAARVTELTAKITARQDRPSGGRRDWDGDNPYNILVVLDGAQVLRGLPGMPQVLRQGPRCGVFTIAIDEARRLLPEECATVAEVTDSGTVRLRGGELEEIGEALRDQVGTAWCDKLARSLAPIREVNQEEGEAAIPKAVRLLDLIGDPDAERIKRQWGRSTRVPLGISAEGIFEVDLSLDGPHALIAGTTGSGKSELLQTLIASLAVANRPDEMTFVLIDYKGGSAFKDCARLPHTVGMVTDLDGHLTERALDSLAAELRRRERLLHDAGAKDIEDYAEGCPAPRIPRLVLIIDEFATLVTELPDFVAGLVDIARRGRSLGVHLILATQRPAGVVTADIQANTSLRIGLRVTDAGESQDVIDGGAAARISKDTPGRCYIRSGASKPLAVQSARIGGRRMLTGDPRTGAHVWPLSWRALGHPLPVTEPAAEEDPVTDLSTLVDAVRSAAADIEPQPSPWLPPLPGNVTVESLAADDGIPFGLTDLPWLQARRSLVLDPSDGGHILIAGAPRTGRTTALRTIAGSVARSVSPADTHLYVIDCGSGALLPLVTLPHCGAVVTRDQTDRVERLLERLREELRRRQEILASGGFASLAEARAAGRKLPWMLLLIDRWEGFLAAYENYDYGRLVNSMLTLLREGSAVGLRAVVAADRSGLIGQISTIFDERLLLRMSDPNDYGLLTIPAKSVPTSMPPGRAISPNPRGLVESQIALLDADDSGQAQVAAVQSLARRHERPPREERPLHVDALPGRITYTETLALDPDFDPPSPLWVLLGAGGDELAPVGVDLTTQGPGCVVAGPPRSGRSTALATAARWLVSRRVPVVLIAPRRSPLTELAGMPGVLGVLGSKAENDPDALHALLREPPKPPPGLSPAQPIVWPSQKQQAPPPSSSHPAPSPPTRHVLPDGTPRPSPESASDVPPEAGSPPEAEQPDAQPYKSRFVVIVDDCELISQESLLGQELARILASGRDHEHGLLLAGTTTDLSSPWRGYLFDALKARTGLLLSVQSPDEGEVFKVRLPRGADSGGPAGRALLVQVGNVGPVQVALPS